MGVAIRCSMALFDTCNCTKFCYDLTLKVSILVCMKSYCNIEMYFERHKDPYKVVMWDKNFILTRGACCWN